MLVSETYILATAMTPCRQVISDKFNFSISLEYLPNQKCDMNEVRLSTTYGCNFEIICFDVHRNRQTLGNDLGKSNKTTVEIALIHRWNVILMWDLSSLSQCRTDMWQHFEGPFISFVGLECLYGSWSTALDLIINNITAKPGCQRRGWIRLSCLATLSNCCSKVPLHMTRLPP